MLNHHNSWVIKLASTAGTLERRAPLLHPMRHWPGVIVTTEDKQAKQTTRRTVASKLDPTRSAAPQFRKEVLQMLVNVSRVDGWTRDAEPDSQRCDGSPVCCTLLHSWAEKRRSPLLASPRQIQLHAPYTGLCILCTLHFTLCSALMRSWWYCTVVGC